MRTWLWKQRKDWSIPGLWFIVVEFPQGGYVAFNTDGGCELFESPFPNTVLWEEVV